MKVKLLNHKAKVTISTLAIFRQLFVVLLSYCLTSCDFNINNSPGPQMSMTVNEAKKHSTFICEYQTPGNKINGVEVQSIFAEKKIWRTEGWFSRNKINCCESQLVIISKQPFSDESRGYDTNWKLNGFQQSGTYLIYKDYKGTKFPDSIAVNIVGIGNNTKLFNNRLILMKKLVVY